MTWSQKRIKISQTSPNTSAQENNISIPVSLQTEKIPTSCTDLSDVGYKMKAQVGPWVKNNCPPLP
jgi:hypothetical protein